MLLKDPNLHKSQFFVENHAWYCIVKKKKKLPFQKSKSNFSGYIGKAMGSHFQVLVLNYLSLFAGMQ